MEKNLSDASPCGETPCDPKEKKSASGGLKTGDSAFPSVYGTEATRRCLSCGSDFPSQSPTNRICARPKCQARRSIPTAYGEFNGHLNKPDGLVHFRAQESDDG